MSIDTATPVLTKGMYLISLYNEFKEIIEKDKELKEFYSLFELLDNIEDVVYMISFVFPSKELTEEILKSIMDGYGITITDSKFKELFPVFKDFLHKFRSV